MNEPMTAKETSEYLELLKKRLVALQFKKISGRLEIKTNGKQPEYLYCTTENGVKRRRYI